MDINFSQFDFGAYSTFLNQDIIGSIVGLAKAYRNIDPIPDGSVIIKRYEPLDAEDQTQKLSMLLQAGTKPLNALMYMNVKKTNAKDLEKAFKIIKVDHADSSNQTSAIKCLVAALIIFISRGQLPATQGNNQRTPLPRFITSVMKVELSNEQELRDAIMDFDPKHINMERLFDKEEHFAGWDEILQNRFNLGVAGHKPLKAIQLVWQKLDGGKKDTKEYKVLAQLHEFANASVNGFYPNLHPSKQLFSRSYPQFYRTTIRLMLDLMTGDRNENHTFLKQLPMFKPDQFVQNEINSFPVNISSWDVDAMKVKIGEVIKFGYAKTGDVKPSTLKLVTHEIKEKEIQKPKSTKKKETKLFETESFDSDKE